MPQNRQTKSELQNENQRLRGEVSNLRQEIYDQQAEIERVRFFILC